MPVRPRRHRTTPNRRPDSVVSRVVSVDRRKHSVDLLVESRSQLKRDRRRAPGWVYSVETRSAAHRNQHRAKTSATACITRDDSSPLRQRIRVHLTCFRLDQSKQRRKFDPTLRCRYRQQLSRFAQFRQDLDRDFAICASKDFRYDAEADATIFCEKSDDDIAVSILPDAATAAAASTFLAVTDR